MGCPIALRVCDAIISLWGESALTEVLLLLQMCIRKVIRVFLKYKKNRLDLTVLSWHLHISYLKNKHK